MGDNMLEIKDYDLVYASQVNKLDEDYWVFVKLVR